MKAWKEERCATQPKELELVAPDRYIQRRNIQEINHKADKKAGIEAYTDYVCESRIITVSEYEMLQSIQEMDTQKAIDAYTEQLIEEGVL